MQSCPGVACEAVRLKWMDGGPWPGEGLRVLKGRRAPPLLTPGPVYTLRAYPIEYF